MDMRDVDVLIIGAGPIGNTCGAILAEKGLSVLSLFTRKPIPFRMENTTCFTWSEWANEPFGFRGREMVWGKAHDLSLEKSELSEFGFTEKEFCGYLKTLEALGWPSINEQQASTFPKLNSANMDFGSFAFKKQKLNIHPDVRYLETDGEIHSWQYEDRHFLLELKSPDGLEKFKIKSRFIIIAAGGIQNPIMIAKFLNIQIAGSTWLGYSNHPKTETFKIVTHKPVRMHPIRQYKEIKFKTLDVWLQTTNKQSTRISSRFWIDPNRTTKSMLLNKIGYTNQISVNTYIQIPEYEMSNCMKFNSNSVYIEYSIRDNFWEMLEKAMMKTRMSLESIFPKADITYLHVNWKEVAKKDANHHIGHTRYHPETGKALTDRYGKLEGELPIFVCGTSILPMSSPNHPSWTAAIFAARSCLRIIEMASA